MIKQELGIKHKFEGDNYRKTKDLNLKEIAKLIRIDLNKYSLKCKKLGFNIKLSVKTEYYSMGQSLHITLQEANFKLKNKDFNGDLNISEANPIHTKKYSKLRDVIDKIIDSYNYDGSDSQIDYFDVRFYHHVGISEKLEDQN